MFRTRLILVHDNRVASGIESFEPGVLIVALAMILAVTTPNAIAAEYDVVQATSGSGMRHHGVPDGLSGSDWSGIRAAYEANRHAVFAVEGGYQARNPGQQWRTRFDGRGFVTTADSGEWSWGLELVSFGRGNALREVGETRPIAGHCGQRMEYAWDETLTEWFVNDQRGLEHGYTVHQRPGGLTGETPVPPLQFTLAVRGDLAPRISGDGRNVAFVNDAGAAVVNYNGLTVFDATGATVPARFEEVKDADGRDARTTHFTESDARTPHPVEPAHSSFSIHQSQFIRIVVDDSDAVYPLTVDPIAQQAYLKASNTDAGDQFGLSVAISGDTVVVGANGEDSNATGVNGNQADNSLSNSGAAYVFVRDAGGTWTQQAYLKASNPDPSDLFGSSVDISGDTIVVGAWLERSNASGVNGNQADNSVLGSGAAYVFVRSGTVWSQQAYLKASNSGSFNRYFGRATAVSGDTIVVGAIGDSSGATGVNGNQNNFNAPNSGAAYVFVRNGTTWSQQAYVKASNTGLGDNFGGSLALDGDTMVICAKEEASNATGVNGNQSDNSAHRAGAAYVFVRDGTTWSQQAYLKASNTEALDEFGVSVSLDNDTAVIGAWLEDSETTGVNGDEGLNGAPDSGAAYIFVRNGTTWSQQAYLKASNTDARDKFGGRVAVSGDLVIVGAWNEASNATGMNGDQSNNTAPESGAAYLFVRDGVSWTQQAYIKSSNSESGDWFGISIALSNSTVFIAAYLEDSNATGLNGDQGDNSATNSGAVYIFELCPNLTGDMNCDCVVNESDIAAFALALLDPTGYGAANSGCSIVNGDMQPDGNVDGADVQGFVSLLIP